MLSLVSPYCGFCWCTNTQKAGAGYAIDQPKAIMAGMNSQQTTRHLTMLVLFSILATVMFLPSSGTADLIVWLEWGRNVDQHGIIQGYAINAHEHPPLFSVLLWVVYRISHLTGLTPFICLKSSFMFFLCLTTTCLYFFSGKNILFTLFFHAIMAYVSLCLSYMDIYFSFFLLLSIFFLHREKIPAFIFCFTVSCLLKYPPLIVAPFFAFYLLKNKNKESGGFSWPVLYVTLKQLIPTSILLAFIFLLFSREPFLALTRAFEHQALSAQALNLNWIFTRILLLSGHATPFQILAEHEIEVINPAPLWSLWTSRVLFAFFYISSLCCFIVKKRDLESLLLFAITGHLAYFIFSVGVHENHLFLSVVLGMALFCVNNKNLPLVLVVALISTMNIFAFYGTNGFGPLIFSHYIDLLFNQCQAAVAELPGSCYTDFSALRHSQPFSNEEAIFNDSYPFDIRLALAIFNVAYLLVLWWHNIKSVTYSRFNSSGS